MAAGLRDVLPLHVLSDDEAAELVSHMRVGRFAQGEVVYHRGDPAGDVLVVHDGLVKSVLQDEQARELVVARYRRGEFFGTLTLFRNGPRESTVTAVVPSTVLQIARSDALHVLERNARAMHFMFERMAETIERLSDQFAARVFLDVRGRLARYLFEVCPLGHTALRQEDIAAGIGANVFTVNKALAEFERRGLIDVQRRRVRILDDDRLRREIRP